MVIKTETAEKDVFKRYNIVSGVSASKYNNVELGDMIPKKNQESKDKYVYNLVLKPNSKWFLYDIRLVIYSLRVLNFLS